MNRRAFTKAAGCAWAGAVVPASPAAVSISGKRLVLTTPPDRPAQGVLRYALAFPFQADATTMGLMVMRMTEETQNYGFLDGSDIVLARDLEKPGSIFPASRNEFSGDQFLLKSPLIGGFVPRGALRVDGTPHPHAGTGFGVGQAHWLAFRQRRFRWSDPGRRDMNELYQLRFDGRTFTSERSGTWTQNGDEPFVIGRSGWRLLVTGINNAISDGDALLSAALAARTDRSGLGVGVVRWERVEGSWAPLGFDVVVESKSPVPRGPNPMEQCPWMEPSVVRDVDGALLFSARGADVPKGLGYNLQVWRSGQGKWRQVLDVPKARLNSPVTINVAGDGMAYLSSNPYDPTFIPETSLKGRGRERLVLWPLSRDRSSVGEAVLVRDCLGEFGEPPGADRGEKWMADHPNGATVRLKDGKWHDVLCYRVCHSPRHASLGTQPSRHSGSYVEELQTGSTVATQWRFAT